MAVMVDTAAVTTEARVATSAMRAYAARNERVSEVWLSTGCTKRSNSSSRLEVVAMRSIIARADSVPSSA